jgi:hypothetical protein
MPTFSQVNEPGDERRPDDFARHGTPLFSEPQMLDAQNKQRLCVLVPPLSGELTGGSVRYKVALNARFPVVTRIPREGPLKQRCTGPSRSRAECLRSWPMRSPRTSNTKRAYRPTATTADFGSFARNRAVHSRPVVSVSRPYPRRGSTSLAIPSVVSTARTARPISARSRPGRRSGDYSNGFTTRRHRTSMPKAQNYGSPRSIRCSVAGQRTSTRGRFSGPTRSYVGMFNGVFNAG